MLNRFSKVLKFVFRIWLNMEAEFLSTPRALETLDHGLRVAGMAQPKLLLQMLSLFLDLC